MISGYETFVLVVNLNVLISAFVSSTNGTKFILS